MNWTLRSKGKVGVKGSLRLSNWASSGNSYSWGRLGEVRVLWLNMLSLRCL